jgi:hypothetical protein
MNDPKTPTHSQDAEASRGDVGSHGGGDPDRAAAFNGAGGGGQSGGGAYPNPHTGKEGESNREGFMGHGGQTEMAYHGAGRLGDEETGGNANAPAKDAGADGSEEEKQAG